MENRISTVDYLDKKLTEIFRLVSPQDDYIENLHYKLRHKPTVQIDKPYYYSLLLSMLVLGSGIILFMTMKKIFCIMTGKK